MPPTKTPSAPAVPAPPATLAPRDEAFAMALTGLPAAFLRTPSGLDFYRTALAERNAARAALVEEIARIRAAVERDVPVLAAAVEAAGLQVGRAVAALDEAQRAHGAALQAMQGRSSSDAMRLARLERQLADEVADSIREAKDTLARWHEETRQFRVTSHVEEGEGVWGRRGPSRVYTNRASLRARLAAILAAREALDTLALSPRLHIADDIERILAGVPAIDPTLRDDEGRAYASPTDTVPATT